MSKLREAVISMAHSGYHVTTDGVPLKPDGSVFKANVNCNGYLMLNVGAEGKYVTVGVHRFVAYLKFGDAIWGKVTRHRNGVKTDNSWDNILIGTNTQNMQDRPKTEVLQAGAKASESFLANYVCGVLRREVIDEIRKDASAGESVRSMAIRFRMDKKTVKKILDNRIPKRGRKPRAL
jgi:hypothetical protein